MAGLVRRKLIRVLGAAIAVSFVALVGVATRPVLGECDGPYPDFRRVAMTANRIVIGDVVALRCGGAWDPFNGGISSRFTLQVRFVVRGDAPALLDVNDLPTQACAGVVGARLGDRIALAVDGRDFQPARRVNMVAWIGAVPPDGFGPGSISQALTLTVNEVYALVGQDPPPQESQPPAEPAVADQPNVPGPLPIWPTGIGVGLAGVLVLIAVTWRRRRRSTAP